jgi:hypothetical protein
MTALLLDDIKSKMPPKGLGSKGVTWNRKQFVSDGGRSEVASNLGQGFALVGTTQKRSFLHEDISQIKEHKDVISSDKKTVLKVDHLDGPDKMKLTKQTSPNGQHHHHVRLNKSGGELTSHWQNERAT